ncbi:TRAP-type C4-dicarboxylate transport system, substrate-binding protein [Salinihabitans flavidus]|uniref:TRAP-type C4-dicarboxylate transport system, substrate-binding protein n=1 Tax=Salinihabitans flavidus TaxID=569882 RepID=A0A1H8P799_9RHOB|nr:TRAP transporter substrate-binding protein DctP [Salinihabitans flavidus]SEO37687.1 TRAP-type C4-dicarboxylate transport system, substrate-binding protein [Salinihabitans flavidus]
MKTTTTFLAALTVAVTFGTAGVYAETLRLGDFQSTSHIVSVEGTTKWMEAVEEATGGEIAFQHFPSQQAAKSKAQLDAVTNGILDAALLGTPYHADVLPLNSVVALPGFYGSAEQGTEALQTMLKEGPLREEILATGVTPIFGFVLPPYQVLAKTRLGEPTDWDAQDIRTSGSTQAMTARALGGVGISIPGPEVYTAVERGRLDAVLFPLASVPGYKLNEVVSHISTNGSFGGYSFVMVVRSDLFDGLSAETQAELIRLGDETALHVAQAQDESVAGLIEKWTAEGIDTYEFTEEELAAMSAELEAVSADWVTRIDNDKAQAVLETYGELISQ